MNSIHPADGIYPIGQLEPSLDAVSFRFVDAIRFQCAFRLLISDICANAKGLTVSVPE